MNAKDLKRNAVYLYTGGADKIQVKFTGTEPKGYAFRAKNKKNNLFDGFRNVLNGLSVRNYIEEIDV